MDIRNGNAKSKKYDWINDPDSYLVEGRIPCVSPDGYSRCFHCGAKYANPSVFSCFCRVCWFEMNLQAIPDKNLRILVETRRRLSDYEQVTEPNFKWASGKSL